MDLIINQGNSAVEKKKMAQLSVDGMGKFHCTILYFMYMEDFQVREDKKNNGTSQYNLVPILKWVSCETMKWFMKNDRF